MSERLAEFLLRAGLMQPQQVEEILKAQRQGDHRRFGDIAVERGYIPDGALKRYLEYLEKEAKNQAKKDYADS